MCRCFKPARAEFTTIKVLTQVDMANQNLPGRGRILRVTFAHGKVRSQGLAVLGEWYFQFSRDGAAVRAGVSLGRKAPAQHPLDEGVEVWQARNRPFRCVKYPLLDAFAQQLVSFGVMAIEEHPGLHKRRRRNHQPGGTHKA